MSIKPPVVLQHLPPSPPQPGTSWHHWKGAIVTVLGTGHHSETGEAVVLYTYDGKFWARPLSMWGDIVDVPAEAVCPDAFHTYPNQGAYVESSGAGQEAHVGPEFVTGDQIQAMMEEIKQAQQAELERQAANPPVTEKVPRFVHLPGRPTPSPAGFVDAGATFPLEPPVEPAHVEAVVHHSRSFPFDSDQDRLDPNEFNNIKSQFLSAAAMIAGKLVKGTSQEWWNTARSGGDPGYRDVTWEASLFDPLKADWWTAFDNEAWTKLAPTVAFLLKDFVPDAGQAPCEMTTGVHLDGAQVYGWFWNLWINGVEEGLTNWCRTQAAIWIGSTESEVKMDHAGMICKLKARQLAELVHKDNLAPKEMLNRVDMGLEHYECESPENGKGGLPEEKQAHYLAQAVEYNRTLAQYLPSIVITREFPKAVMELYNHAEIARRVKADKLTEEERKYQ